MKAKEWSAAYGGGGGRGKWKKAEDLVFEMFSNAMFLNTIMDSLCKDGRFMKAHNFFDRVRPSVMY